MIQDNPSWVVQFLDWLKENTIGFVIFGLGWKGIDKYFEWLTKNTDARLSKLIEEKIGEKVTPTIQKLTDSIDDLKEAIWALKNK